jgi:hypothetical protein
LTLTASLSTLSLLLGDRWLLGAGCERIDEPAFDWLRRRGIVRTEALLAPPLDKPNTVLIFKRGSGVRLTTSASSAPAGPVSFCTWIAGKT